MTMAKQPSRIREFFRKRLVALKRKPQLIALAVLAIAFIYYSFNLSSIANTTALINGPHMGLSSFAVMLLSVLSLVCFMNAFPHRKKAVIPMVVLTFVMLGILIFCDYYYDSRITAALTREVSPIVPTGKNAFVAVTQNVIAVHRILLIIGAALFALLPVYSKLLRKINTSIEVEENKDMGTIDISGEDA
jgi:D-alanyl-lipoteichoic acid acyltransferase DltB (MBOAT superfamily)